MDGCTYTLAKMMYRSSLQITYKTLAYLQIILIEENAAWETEMPHDASSQTRKQMAKEPIQEQRVFSLPVIEPQKQR